MDLTTNNYFWYVLLAIIIAAVAFWYYFKGRIKGRIGDIRGLGLGPTPALDRYSKDLTSLARKGELDPVINREKEIARTIHILSRKKKSNPVLIGPPGVGKTAIVEGLAQRIVEGKVPERLKDKRVLDLDLSGLMAGTKYRGEFEIRMKRITSEIERAERSIILFIDELHILTETRGTEGAVAASDILKPSLARGVVQAIGATTPEEYENYIMKDLTLERRFQPVIVREPSIEDSIKILQGLRKAYEDYHKVEISDEVIKTAVNLSAKYIKNRYLPDKAIDLIDEACAKAKLAIEGKPQDKVTVEDIKDILSEWVDIPKEKLK